MAFNINRFNGHGESTRYEFKTVGFTGTRNGMTEEQRVRVRLLLRNLDPDFGLHGDCVGADNDFDELCLELGIPRHIRPCTFEKMRANCDRKRNPAEQIAEPAPPMARNRAIVADCTLLVACPPNDRRIKKGAGTWATVGFAEKAKRLHYVVLPDGSFWNELMPQLKEFCRGQ